MDAFYVGYILFAGVLGIAVCGHFYIEDQPGMMLLTLGLLVLAGAAVDSMRKAA
jgi:hypothetical protein